MPAAVASPPTPTSPASPELIASPYGVSVRATSTQRAPGPTRTRPLPRTSTSLRRPRSTTTPRSAVELPVTAWPPLRIASGTSCFRAYSSASATCSGISGRSTSPGEPAYQKFERTLAYPRSPGSTAVRASEGGTAS